MPVVREAAAPDLPSPSGWRVEEGDASLRVRWSNRARSLLLLVPIAIGWNAVVVYLAWEHTRGFQDLRDLIFGLLLPHVWVGIALLYASLVGLFNRHTVSVGGRVLRVENGPFPAGGYFELPIAELEQLFVVEHRRRVGGARYELCALLRDGRRVTVLDSVDDATEARFLEGRIERLLEIRDVPIEGELSR